VVDFLVAIETRCFRNSADITCSVLTCPTGCQLFHTFCGPGFLVYLWLFYQHCTIFCDLRRFSFVLSKPCNIGRTNILTPWSTVLLEKLIVTQTVKMFPVLFGTPRFITVFKRACFPRTCVTFRNELFFYGEKLLAPCTNPKLGGPKNVGILPQHYMTSQPIRPRLEYFPSWKPQVCEL